MSGRFTGYAALFDRVDRAGDVIRAGAFGEPRTVPLLWQHRGDPVGHASVREDAQGLAVEGVIDDPDLAASVRSGAVAGLSVGYRPRAVRQAAHRELTAVDLVEVSLVAIPMQSLARVDRFFT
ncbi:HK97 family phage prohead protease [Sphingomonas bacterium]|uniref:HK97 family phage prohead protease n=1 Tax=Sphingomonas bacterium TaxID=1895847 RepID=UPI0015769FE0|nr:HK97 family phage prohead protease [Sphingomonas bacterium]